MLKLASNLVNAIGSQGQQPKAPAPARAQSTPRLATDAFARTAAVAPQAQSLPSPDQVTGNGYGFAVYDPAAGGLSKFYIHPYRFTGPNPKNPRGEGISTPNVLSHLGWEPRAAKRSAAYVSQSQVIGTTSDAGQERFFMPFGLNRAALVTTMAPASGKPAALDLQWHGQVESKRKQVVNGQPYWVVKLKGVKETLVVVPLAGGTAPEFGKTLTGAPGWAIVSVEDARQAEAAARDVQTWQGTTPAAGLAQRETQEMDRWRVQPGAEVKTDAERKLWRQSETVLRMGQVREPNNAKRSGSGLILASLPEGEWFIAWVRDMTYSTVALTRMGHQDEARKALDAMLAARGVGREHGKGEKDYQISTVRYFGNGAEEKDYSGEKLPNLEFDSWGLSLWAFGNYFSKYNDTAWLSSKTKDGTVYSEVRDAVVAPLLDKLEPYGGGLVVAADTSVWEQNDSARKHYAFSTIAAISGLQSFLPMAEAAGDTKTVNEVKAKLAALHKGFNAAYVKDGKLRGTLENSPRNEMDGCLLEALNMGVVTDPELIKSTLDRMDVLKTSNGGYRRVTGDTGYELQEFVFIDYALARALRAQGRDEEARAIEDRITQMADAQKDLIPEMYMSQQTDDFEGPIGSPTGAIPMVGYGAGTYVLNMLDRQRAATAAR